MLGASTLPNQAVAKLAARRELENEQNRKQHAKEKDRKAKSKELEKARPEEGEGAGTRRRASLFARPGLSRRRW